MLFSSQSNNTTNMKKRQIKKQIKKIIGIMSCNGEAVYNFVSNSKYDGGTCVRIDEDCFKSEITYTRKQYGAPLLLHSKWNYIFETVHNNNINGYDLYQ